MSEQPDRRPSADQPLQDAQSAGDAAPPRDTAASEGAATTQPLPTQPGYPPPAGYPAAAPQPYPPPGYAAPQPYPEKSGSGTRRKAAGLVAAAVLLAGTSGLTGALLTSQLTDTSSSPSTSTTPAAELDRSSLAALVAKVQPTVVSIKTGSGEGSGVVIDDQGDILTNNHVVATANGDTVTVTSSKGDTTRATIVGTDPRSDLAVVKAADRTGLSPGTFGDSDAVRVGDSVLALGSPLGLEGSVTAGIVSAKDRTIQVGGENGSPASSISGMIQTDAAVNPGNSGGPLVDMAGRVIGINSAIATSGNSNGNIGVGFAIPSNTASRVADQLIAGRQVSHPYLGVSVGDATGGALVQAVASGGPAEQAGLRAGDLITKLGDRTITGADDLVAAVQAAKVGDRLDVTYTRDGSQQHATVTLAEAPTG